MREIIELLHDREVFPYTDLIEGFEIIEDGDTFKENALISGISVDVLGGAPGIYSARYGGEGASDRDNLLKLVKSLKEKNFQTSPAHYTAAIAIVSREGENCVHGWMHGDVITELRGENGFGYDPIFIPSGYVQTLGELASDVKKGLSHRSKGLELAKILIDQIKFLRSHAGSTATK
ncbi:hypothetical protein B649_11175 [Candidatus Sulfuricurvum sp. RIFRC-1]|uniref:non-canonical purine NTP pyrophosphatase n=1 Tax=Candidatus Sulfuricurvum sp. RIFRC-1 TaxID=1249480 RepID=UPI000299602E|nr:non-canonical purine NTP pyrophosphatase [Candidatus Sulfuricurvum sp. RIFRC-1]AFV98546.1 hypothetical protein B649_11175 [Candidatus Sulfuricurvum sp. RIFRC-1]